MKKYERCCDVNEGHLQLVAEDMQNVAVQCDNCGDKFVTSLENYENSVIRKYSAEIRETVLRELNNLIITVFHDFVNRGR